MLLVCVFYSVVLVCHHPGFLFYLVQSCIRCFVVALPYRIIAPFFFPALFVFLTLVMLHNSLVSWLCKHVVVDIVVSFLRRP